VQKSKFTAIDSACAFYDSIAQPDKFEGLRFHIVPSYRGLNPKIKLVNVDTESFRVRRVLTYVEKLVGMVEGGYHIEVSGLTYNPQDENVNENMVEANQKLRKCIMDLEFINPGRLQVVLMKVEVSPAPSTKIGFHGMITVNTDMEQNHKRDVPNIMAQLQEIFIAEGFASINTDLNDRTWLSCNDNHADGF